jgi:methyl-accepting chemotaxis protein
MNNDEIFAAVKQINTLVNNAQKNINEANATIKESLPLLKELLDTTRQQSTQTSLDEFTKRLTLEDIRKMLEGD